MAFKVHQEAAERLVDWLFSDDTGISSCTIAAVALGVTRRKIDSVNAPYDPADFGRCYRLVLAVPEVIDVFPQVAKVVPVFKGILDNWDELCELYERDLPTGKCAELHRRISELRGDRPKFLKFA